MSGNPQRGGAKRRWIAIAGGCALLLAVFYFFPLFRIVDLDAAVKEKRSKIFDPRSYGEKFWFEDLPAAADKAVDVTDLVAALASDPEAAKAKHGRMMGLGGIHSFHLRGTGTIVAVGEKAIGLSVDGGDTIQVEFPTGLIFSNAVRDATGLIQVSAFASSRHFNDISSELNKRVEAEVLPALRKNAAPGVRLSFVGCAELAGDGNALPLKVIPVSIEFE